MGKGDKKTRKGKITMGSYGVTRTKNKKTVAVISKKATKTKTEEEIPKKVTPKKVATAKKAATKKEVE